MVSLRADGRSPLVDLVAEVIEDIGTQMEEINREAGPLPLVRAFHDDSSRSLRSHQRDRHTEPQGGVPPRLGVPKGACSLRGDSTRGQAPL